MKKNITYGVYVFSIILMKIYFNMHTSNLNAFLFMFLLKIYKQKYSNYLYHQYYSHPLWIWQGLPYVTLECNVF